jgi:hypothetical protein
MRHHVLCALIGSICTVSALGQTATSMPSKAEISELLNKANEKISAFEEAVRRAKPYLDKVGPKLSVNYLDAASTAHLLIESTQKNGPSTYALVGILSTMDDLSLDAANACVRLLQADEEQVTKGKAPDAGALGSVVLLTNAGGACNDIAELIMHATMRLIRVEEELLQKLMPQ